MERLSGKKRGTRKENTGWSMIMARAEINAKCLSWGQLLTSGQEAAKGDYHNTMVNPKTATRHIYTILQI